MSPSNQILMNIAANMDIQTVEKYKRLEEEFNTIGLSMEDTHTLLSILQIVRRLGYAPQKCKQNSGIIHS